MKLMAGIALFLLCALAGEGKSRRLLRREQMLFNLHELIGRIGAKQLTALVSFREAALSCPPSSERDQLLGLAEGREIGVSLLKKEEADRLMAYARSESRSPSALRAELDGVLSLLRRAAEQARAERVSKGQICRSMGIFVGAAALLLVL